MDKEQIQQLRNEVFTNTLAAYRAARQVQGSPNHPFITGLRAYLITHFGREGRQAVEVINREVQDAKKAEVQQATQASPKARRSPSPGGKRPAIPLGERRPSQDKRQQAPSRPQSESADVAEDKLPGGMTADEMQHVGPRFAKAMKIDIPMTGPTDAHDPLSESELSAILEMKAAAAGKEYGAGRLTATLSALGQEMREGATQTQLAAQLINFLKK